MSTFWIVLFLALRLHTEWSVDLLVRNGIVVIPQLKQSCLPRDADLDITT